MPKTDKASAPADTAISDASAEGIDTRAGKASKRAKGSKKPKLAVMKASKARRKSRTETYSSYVYKVLKQVHPELGISRRAMSTMNSILNDLFERIASEAGRLTRYSKRSTLSSREIQSAVRLVLPGELAKHATSQGLVATTTEAMAGRPLGLRKVSEPAADTDAAAADD